MPIALLYRPSLRHRIRSASVALAVALAALAVVAPLARAALQDTPWQWTDRTPRMLDVACPGVGQCVAVGTSGWVLTSSEGGAPLQWSGVPLSDVRQKLMGVACTGSRCLAVSGGNPGPTNPAPSAVFRSDNSGAPGSWSDGVPLPPAPNPAGGTSRVGYDIACDPDGTCFVAGPKGGVWRSVDDGRSWDPLPQPSKLGLPYNRLACPANGLCILVGTSKGSAVLRGDQATKVDMTLGGGTATAIACDTATHCVAADNQGRSFSIESPWAKWAGPTILPGKEGTVLSSLACPAKDTCVGISAKPPGRALVTDSVSSNAWRAVNTTGPSLAAVGCAGSACAAAGGGASWFESANTGVNWHPVNEVPALHVLDCPAAAPAGTCLGGGDDAIGKTTSAGDFWTTPYPGLTTLDTAAVTCIGYPNCLVVGKSKVLFTPDAGNTWDFRFAAGDVTAGPAGGACFSSVRCYGAGNGSVFTTFNGALTPWQPSPIRTAPAETLTGMACPTQELCLVSGSSSIYRGELAVVDGRANWNWTPTDASAIEMFNAVSCSSVNTCTAVGPGTQGFAQVATTTDPQLLHWDSQELKNPFDPGDPTPLMGVSCPVDGVCVAAGKRGYVYSTQDNWANYSVTRFEPSVPVTDSETLAPDFAGVSCQSASRCLLLGSKAAPPAPANGAVFIGTTG